MPKKDSDTIFYQHNSDGPYYKLVRFKTGETILCMMDTDVRVAQIEQYLELIRPVLAYPTQDMMNKSTGNSIVGAEVYQLRPWIGATKSERLTIGTEMVLTVCEMSDRMRLQYSEWVDAAAKAEATQTKIEDDDAKRRALMKLLLSVSKSGKVEILKEGEEDEAKG